MSLQRQIVILRENQAKCKLNRFQNGFFESSKWTPKRMHLKLVDLFKEINEELLCSKIGLTIERVNLVEDNQHTHSTDRDFVTISQYSTAAVCTVSKDRGLYIKDRNLISDLKFSNVLKQFGVDINLLAFRQEINEVLKS